MASGKSPGAFLTIGELSARLGVPQHILRYWETRFPQLRPVQRAGNRRYYRPEDVTLAERIHRLLGTEGYTVKGVQQLLAKKGGDGHARKWRRRKGGGVGIKAVGAAKTALSSTSSSSPAWLCRS